jgi:hypothetical protein
MRPSRVLLFVALFLLMNLFTQVFAQQPITSGVYVVGPGVKAPVVLSAAANIYG